TDRYIAGSFEIDGQPNTTYPCYWKNGVKHNLPFDKLPPFLILGARDVIIHDNKVYILGSHDWSPVLWIIDGTRTETLLVDTDTNARTSSNFVMHNNKIYIGGHR